MAVVREVGGKSRLEFPVGQVLYQTVGWLSHPRISPDGDRVAFLEHPLRRDDGGVVCFVDRAGRKKTLAGAFSTEAGLAWSADGREVWFTAAKFGGNRALNAVSLSGKERLIARVTQSLTLQDVAKDGRVLASHDTIRIGIQGRGVGEEKERELAWLDWSVPFDITPDGKMILFSETGEGSGPAYSTFIRGTDGSAPVRLGDGVGLALSPDKEWALSITPRARKPELVLYPTGAGEKRVLATGDLAVEAGGGFLPDGKRLIFNASEPGHGTRLFLIGVPDGKPKALTPEGYRTFPKGISPDGRRVVAVGPDRRRYLYPVEGGEPTPLPGLSPDETPAQWSADGRYLYVYRRRDVPAKVWRLEIATGKRELWKELMPADGAGIATVGAVLPTPDGSAYVYSYFRTLSDLYVVEGVK
jgi:hypothetical protein